MIKYGTFAMFQNKDTDEVKEVPLADEEELKKYAGDKDWKRVGAEDSSETSTKDDTEKAE